jgi:hypothetical protein
VAQAESPEPEMPEATGAIAPGSYCYRLDDGVTEATAQLTINPDFTASGEVQGAVQDYENNYFTSYEQLLNGTLEGETLNLDVTTAIELDTQQTQEIWQVTSNGLNDGRNTYNLVDCETLFRAGADPSQNSGLEALGIDPNALMDPVQVQFAPGTNSTIIENAVIRGTRDVYLLWAEAGQTMSVEISSLEDNAVFDILAPSSEVIRWEAVAEEFVLPETGDYQILVGGTRGNASYSLDITIR